MHAPPTRGSRASRSAQTRALRTTSPPRPRRLVRTCEASHSGCFDTHGRGQRCPHVARSSCRRARDGSRQRARAHASDCASTPRRSLTRSLPGAGERMRSRQRQHVLTCDICASSACAADSAAAGTGAAAHSSRGGSCGSRPAPRLGRAARAAEQPRGREEGTRRRQLRRRPLKRRVAEQRRSSVAAPDSRHARTKATCCAILLCSGFFVVAGAARRHRRQLETCASRKPQETASRASYGYSITPLGSRCPLLAS